MQKVLHVFVQALWPKCNVIGGQQVSSREYARFADLTGCLSLALMHNFRIQLCMIITVLLPTYGFLQGIQKQLVHFDCALHYSEEPSSTVQHYQPESFWHDLVFPVERLICEHGKHLHLAVGIQVISDVHYPGEHGHTPLSLMTQDLLEVCQDLPT